MEAKEKADELIMKFAPDLINISGMNDETYEINKKFALISVDLVLSTDLYSQDRDYWIVVRQIIDKL